MNFSHIFKKHEKRLLKLSILAIIIILIFTIILMFFDDSNFRGFNENESENIYIKFINRLYFTMTTISSTGYGDVSPKSISIKIISMILQFALVIVLLGGIFEV